MPFHFHFNFKEEFKDAIVEDLIFAQLFRNDNSKQFRSQFLENISLKNFKELQNFAKHPFRFQKAMSIIAFGDGDDEEYPGPGQNPQMLEDYKVWKDSNKGLTHLDNPYFGIKEDFLRSFVSELDQKGLYLIVKFGCDSEGKNLSILLAGMERNNEIRMSEAYIECPSISASDSTLIKFGEVNDEFSKKIGNFEMRLPGGINPKHTGVSHNTRSLVGSGSRGHGFLDYYLTNRFTNDSNNETIFIHPAIKNEHQNRFTAVFSGKSDIYNQDEYEWEISKVYDFGGACCPPY